MSYPVMPLGFLGSQGDQDTYRIERSLRFNSADSAYLNRTPASAGNRKTWTWSGWVKRGTLGATQRIFTASNATTIDDSIAFLSSDALTFYFYNNSYQSQIVTTALFRDVSSWYHIIVSVDTTQATAANRIKFYVNGSEITSFSTSTYPTQNFDGDGFNTTLAHNIGRYQGNSAYFNGYLTEINFIDGQALTPSSFGETDALTGRWKAKAYSGTYGTNGFYLKFADNSGTTATTLGKDSSGNGNNWTPNNFSVTAGAGNDSLVDSPTNYGTDTGVGGEVRGNYCTANPNDRSSTVLANGNLDVSGAGGAAYYVGRCTISVSYGKWYWEALINSAINSTYYPSIGIVKTDVAIPSQLGDSSNGVTYMANGQKYTNATLTNYGASFTQNDVIGMALDMDNGTLTCYKNGASQGQIVTGLTGTYSASWNVYASTALVFNFGQRPFAYTAPSGFKALCAANLPQPTIQKPSRYMDVVTWTGDGSSSRTISGLGFSPDLVWMKTRNAANSHLLYDIVRGASSSGSSKALHTNGTNAEGTINDNSTFGYLDSFNSNGFGLVKGSSGDYTNLSGNTYVAWAWDEAPIAGMDIVAFTAPSGTSQSTVAHSLGVAPKMIIVKDRNNGATNWPVFHASVCDTTSKFFRLNTTDALGTFSTIWGANLPTASVFGVTGSAIAASGSSCIAYLFAEVEGFSKFGSYTGNGSADGPFVWCGFRPRWVMIKMSSSTGDWYLFDTARDTFNATQLGLIANSSQADGTYAGWGDITSNGFKIRRTDAAWNTSGGTYIFAAFSESPFKYSRAR